MLDVLTVIEVSLLQASFVGKNQEIHVGSIQIRRRQWHPTPVLLPGKSHGRRNLVGCSPWGREESDTAERLQFHFSLLCIGEGNGNPLQCSCLENPRDGVTQSWTRLKWLSSSSSSIQITSISISLHLSLFLYLFIDLSVYLLIYHPSIYYFSINLSTYLPVTDPEFTWIRPSPVQCSRVFSSFLLFHSPNSLLLKWEGRLHLLVTYLLSGSVPLTGLHPCGCLLSLPQLWFHIPSCPSTWTAAHPSWALTPPISPLQRDPARPPGALESLTVSPSSPLPGFWHSRRGLAQQGPSPVSAWARPPAPGKHSLKMFLCFSGSHSALGPSYPAQAPSLGANFSPPLRGCPPYPVWALSPSQASPPSRRHTLLAPLGLWQWCPSVDHHHSACGLSPVIPFWHTYVACLLCST